MISSFCTLSENDRIYSKKETEIILIRILKSLLSISFVSFYSFAWAGGVVVLWIGEKYTL